MSKSSIDNINPKHSFFKDLFLLRQNKKAKMKITMKKQNSKRKLVPSSKPTNTNASLDREINEDERSADIKDNNFSYHKVVVA